MRWWRNEGGSITQAFGPSAGSHGTVTDGRKRAINNTTLTPEEIAALVAELDAPDEEDSQWDAVVDDVVLQPSAEGNDDVHDMQAVLTEFSDPEVHVVEDPEVKAILDELHLIGFSNISDFIETYDEHVYGGLNDDGDEIYHTVRRIRVKDFSTLDRKLTASVKKIKITQKPSGDHIELELYDKLSALEKLAKHYGVYKLSDDDRGDGSFLDILMGTIGNQGLPKPGGADR